MDSPRAVGVLLVSASLVLSPGFATGQAPGPPAERPGIAPETPWACPANHPIKGYRTDESGLVHHRPGSRFYEETSPERCYASEEEARRDGSRRAPEG
jgi:hypothetical protein